MVGGANSRKRVSAISRCSRVLPQLLVDIRKGVPCKVPKSIFVKK